ncbi:MAG: undecaprenyl-diphosphate phosphatase [Patescibacteria group bacterium]|jgi:undecaprenyl-diphosphatase
MFLDIIKAIILAIVEGLTEFLPVSSTGHLIIVNQWLNFNEPFTTLFDIVIQLGAILAVVVFFWKRLWPFSQDKVKQKTTLTLWYKIIIAVVPALLLGALFNDVIEAKLFNPWIVAIMLFIGGLAIIYVETTAIPQRFSSLGQLTYKTALAIGFIQCLAMIPGTSRSAATIIGAMLLGAARPVAAEFSFFLAIPTMLAASGYSLLKYDALLTTTELSLLAIGFVTAFFVAWLVVNFFIRYVQQHDFKLFGYYRIILGVIVLVLSFIKP